MPEAPVISMFKTLQQAAHQAFGVSGRSYGRKRRIPLQGAGQGNGAGPAIWAAISSVLIMAMANQGHGFNIPSALSGLLVSIVCYAFVDDTDIIHAAASTSVKGEEVIGQMQEILDRWGGLLRATGGALHYILGTTGGWSRQWFWPVPFMVGCTIYGWPLVGPPIHGFPSFLLLSFSAFRSNISLPLIEIISTCRTYSYLQ